MLVQVVDSIVPFLCPSLKAPLRVKDHKPEPDLPSSPLFHTPLTYLNPSNRSGEEHQEPTLDSTVDILQTPHSLFSTYAHTLFTRSLFFSKTTIFTMVKGGKPMIPPLCIVM